MHYVSLLKLKKTISSSIKQILLSESDIHSAQQGLKIIELINLSGAKRDIFYDHIIVNRPGHRTNTQEKL